MPKARRVSRWWQAGREGQGAVVVAHAAEAGDGDDPGARQRGDVQPVAGVVLEVLEIDQGGFGEVVVGQLEVPDLGRDDRLGAGRQRGVAHGQRLVVGEVAGLLLGAEGVSAQVQGEHEVGLLDHLLAIEVEVGEVQQQRVLLGARCARSPTAGAR